MNPRRNRTPLSLALAAAAGLGLSGDAGLLASAPRALAGVARVMAGSTPLLLALEAQAAPPAAAAATPGARGQALSLRLATSPESANAPLQVAALAGPQEEPIPGEPGATLIRPTAPAAPAPKLDREAAVAALDTRVLAQRVSTTAAPHDAFAPRSWAPPPPPPPPPAPPAPPAPPEAPVAPPLPFRYMGMMEESETASTVYLAQGERLITAAPGDTIDNTYRVDALKGRTLHFTYLPLNQRQSLPLGPVTP